MSVTLPVVDMSAVVVGSAGKVQIQQADLAVGAMTGDKLPVLQIYNDSGAGLSIQLPKSGHSFYLPAKGHATVGISPSETEMDWFVQNIATNIQVNQLFVVYFYPWEEVADFTPLGTSTVSQQATTLVNTGNAANTPIIFAEQVGDTSPSGSVNISNSGLASFGDPTSPGKVVVSGTAGTNNIFPTEISILGAGSENIDLFFVGSNAFMNLINQAGIKDISLASGSIAINGSTSGSATLYQPLQGIIKLAFVFFVNFRNGNAGDQLLTFPTAFTNNILGISTASGPFHLNNGGVAQSVFSQTGFPAAAGNAGTNSGSTVGTNSLNVFHVDGPVDQIGLFGSQPGAVSGVIVMFGK